MKFYSVLCSVSYMRKGTPHYNRERALAAVLTVPGKVIIFIAPLSTNQDYLS